MAYVKLTCNTFRPDPKIARVEKEKPKPIKKNSVKRAKQTREYMALRKVYLENNPLCAVKLKGCTKAAIEMHHAEKRTGFRLTDVLNFVAICRSCHIKVENDNIKL